MDTQTREDRTAEIREGQGNTPEAVPLEETGERANTTPEMLEELVGHAIMATREGKMAWVESFRPNAFRARIGPRPGDSMDLEILREGGNGKVKAVLWNRGDLVASFHPRAEIEAAELLEHLERNAVQEDQKVRTALEQIQELRGKSNSFKEIASTRREWTIQRGMSARDGEDEPSELDVQITFSEPEGTPTEWEHWEQALDYFLQYDDLNTFLQDTDFWHCRTDFLLTGTAFELDPESVDPGAEKPALAGTANRYVAMEGIRGDYHTYSDEEHIVSRVKIQMEFDGSEESRRVLRHIREG